MPFNYTREMIVRERELLEINRRNAAQYIKQIAMHDVAHVPPVQIHGLRESIKNIARIKGNFRGAVRPVAVDDQPMDTYDFGPFEI